MTNFEKYKDEILEVEYRRTTTVGDRGMKLKPCPNCGSSRVYIWHICTARLPWGHYAECEDCHWCGKTKLFRRRAIRAWNKEGET